MDDVPITLRKAFDSPFPDDEEILTAIKKRVRELVLAKGQARGATGESKAAAPMQ
jgi:hypothetical protein